MTVYLFKGLPIVTPFTIRSNQPSWDSDSISLKSFRSAQEAQRWELSFTVTAVDGLPDYLVDLITTFDIPQTMIMPQLVYVDKVATAANVVVANNYVAGDDSINVTTSGVLPKGSFVKFANHDKIYLVKNTISGSGTIGIYPALIAAVPSTTQLNHPNSVTKPTITYLQEIDNTRGIVFSDGLLMDPGTITIKEVV